MSSIGHAHDANNDASWSPGKSTVRSLRELVGEYAQALRATALAERDRRHANAIRALYVEEPNPHSPD